MNVATLLSELTMEYPRGVSFDPMAVRLLRQKIPFEEWQIEKLKSEMIQLENGLWFSTEMIADDDSRLEFERHATEWIEEWGCFSVKRLFEYFRGYFQHINTPKDCTNFLKHLGFKVNESGTGGDFCYLSSHGLNNSLKAISEVIAEWLGEASGTLPIDEIEQKLPYLTSEALESIRSQLMPEIYVVEIGGILCWCNTEAIPLPEDFSEKLTTVVDTLLKLGKRLTVANLEFALNLLYRTRIRDEFDLQDNVTFKRICVKHYEGEKEIGKPRTREKGASKTGKRTRSPNTRFSNLGVPIGAKLTFTKDSNVTCKVIDDTNQVQYNGKIWAISTLAVHLFDGSSVNGFYYFSYEGETLWERRVRLEQQIDRANNR